MAQNSKVAAALSIGGLVILGSAPAQAAFIVPGDLTTGGTATAGPGTTPTNEVPANAFDDNAATKVLVFTNPTPAVPITLDYDFAGNTANVVRSYSLTSANDVPERDPATFRLLGSNDNFATPGVVLDTRTNVVFADTDGVDGDRFETLFFRVPGTPSTPYQQIRLEIQESKDPANDRPQLAELQLFSTVIPEPSSLVGLVLVGGAGLLRRRAR